MAVAARDILEAAVEAKRKEQAELKGEYLPFERLESLWSDWLVRQQSKAELATINAPDDLPEDIQERLANAKADLSEVCGRLEQLQKQRTQHEKRLARISPDDRLIDIESDSEALYAVAAGYLENLRRLPTLQSEVKGEEKQVEAALADLGPDWDRERVASFDASIPAVTEVTVWAERIHSADSAHADASRNLDEATRRATEVAADVSRLQEELKDYGDIPSSRELDDLESRASRLKALIIERGAAEAAVENSEMMASLSMAQGPGALSPTALISMGLVLAGLAALLAIAAVAMGITRQVPATVILAAAGISVGVLGYYLSRAGQRAVSAAEEVPADAAVVSTNSLLESRRNELARIVEAIREVASELGLPDKPTPLEGEELTKNLARLRQQRATADQLSGELERSLDRKLQADQQTEAFGAARVAASAEVESVAKRWDTWRTRHGIPEVMNPNTMAALCQSVKACRDSLARLQQLQDQVGDPSISVEGFEHSANDILRKAGEKSPVNGSTLVAAVTGLHKRVLEDQTFRQNKKGLETAIAGIDKELKGREAEKGEAEHKRMAVLAEVSVTDEVELRALVGRVKRRQELALAIQQSASRLDAALGLGPAAEEMCVELATGRVDEWKAGKLSTQERMRNLDNEIEAAVREHENAVQEVSRISESSDIANLENLKEELCQEIAGAVGRWERLALARALVEETVILFEKNNQGPVVDYASSLFNRITDGHYPRLFAHEGSLDVEDNVGKRISVASLSTGAAQQVYMCLRLGLAEEEASKRASLPLIMDEVLVNFDDERVRGVAEAIADVAQRHQVMMFTCHPPTVELMRKTCGKTHVIELKRFIGAPRVQPSSSLAV